jgi:hypothetical protein
MAREAVFDVFPCGARSWCARRADALVCGYFVDQAGAVRFVRRETCGLGVVKIHDFDPAEMLLRRAA